MPPTTTTHVVFVDATLDIVPPLQAVCDAQNALGFRLAIMTSVALPNGVGFVLIFDDGK